MIPERLFQLLRSCEDTKHFPPTEVFNEGWMLRLLLEALGSPAISAQLPDHPLCFLADATWYSEAKLSSVFHPRHKRDPLGEGHTNVDGVIGHFGFDSKTKTGLCLPATARQFVVVEAKMRSNLDTKTKNGPGYHQAARSVACMAATLAAVKPTAPELESVGFFVIAPKRERRRTKSNLETCLKPDSIRSAVSARIARYELASRPEAEEFRTWERGVFLPLLEHLDRSKRLRVLSWDECIDPLMQADETVWKELHDFYTHCLDLAS
jgi:hypothetical protein